MELIGNIIIYIIMACAVAGAIASIVKEESELGKQFIEGINSIGPTFLPVAGIMAAAPFLTKFVTTVFGPIFEVLGADSAMAATTFIAIDMGGYQLADLLAKTREGWIMAMITGYMAGATLVFSIPVGLKMVQKRDYKYLALGVMCGLLTIPIGVLVSSLFIMLTQPQIRELVSTDSVASYQLALTYIQIFKNLLPLIIICVAMAIGLYFKPNTMIKGFVAFGKGMDSILKLVFVACVVEYFTGVFSTIFGTWGFEPIIADAVDQARALEVAGAIGIMLCGAFPMVYLLKKYLEKPLANIGRKVGLSMDAIAGIVAASANVLALFTMIKDMKPEDKVKTLAFAVCGAFLFGDHLAFTANFQPTLILPILLGKFVAGIIAVGIATKLAVPRVIKLEEEEQEFLFNH